MKLVIPSEYQIGAHTYKIRFNDKLLILADLKAQCSHPDQIVRLSAYGTQGGKMRRSNTVLFEMLLHEILHPIDHLYCGSELTEQQIEAISAGLTQSLLSLGIEPDFSEIQEEEL